MVVSNRNLLFQSIFRGKLLVSGRVTKALCISWVTLKTPCTFENLEDSFLWDDGWDDPHSLWEFDKERFPARFDEVSKRARDYGAGTGVWLSPWGGYGFTQDWHAKKHMGQFRPFWGWFFLTKLFLDVFSPNSSQCLWGLSAGAILGQPSLGVPQGSRPILEGCPRKAFPR